MNSNGVLLGYASRHGSTQEVAEAVAAELHAAGLEVETQPMHDVGSLDKYGAVVLGAAIYNARLHADAHAFISQHRQALEQRTVAIFALGPLSTSSAAMTRSRRQLEAELAPYPWLKPIAVEMFVGKMDPTKLGFFDRLGTRASDNRDWSAIRSWARSLAGQLQQTLALSIPA